LDRAVKSTVVLWVQHSQVIRHSTYLIHYTDVFVLEYLMLFWISTCFKQIKDRLYWIMNIILSCCRLWFQ